MIGRHKPGICAAAGCGGQRILVGRGLCSRHYQEFRRKGILDDFNCTNAAPRISMDVKKCGKCKMELPIEYFTLNGTELFPSRRHSVCRQCRTPQHRIQQKRRLSSVRGRATDLLTNARVRSAEKGLICTLDEKWIRSQLAKGCELTGLPFDLETGRSIGRFNPYCPSIDRKVAGGNYTTENCRIVIMAINVAMNAWGEELYRKIARAHFKHRRAQRANHEISGAKTYDMLLENPPSLGVRKH